MVYSEIHPGDGAGSHSIAMANFYDGKKVAVTGGSGLVGSYVIKALAESGAKVRAIVHRRPPNEYTRMATEIVSKNLMNYLPLKLDTNCSDRHSGHRLKEPEEGVIMI